MKIIDHVQKALEHLSKPGATFTKDDLLLKMEKARKELQKALDVSTEDLLLPEDQSEEDSSTPL